jgi:hypothetical protein
MLCPEEGKVVFNRTFYANPWYTSKDSRNPARSSRQAFREIDWSRGATITLGPAQNWMLFVRSPGEPSFVLSHDRDAVSE